MAGRFTVEAVFKAIDKMSAPVKRMSSTMTRFTRGAERGLKRVNAAVSKLTKALGQGLKRGAAVAGVALAAVGVTLKGLANDADALAKQSRRLDFPIEDLQEWKFVAEQSGLSTQEFDKSIEGMSKRFGEAKANTGSLFTFLNKNNKALLKQVKATDSVSGAFELMIKEIESIEDPLERAALANAAFGRSGAKVINIAEQGAKQIEALRREQRENGIITKQQAEAAEAFNDALNSLKKAGIGFLQEALLPILPVLTDLIKQFRQWTIENRGIVSEKVLSFLNFMVNDFDKIINQLKEIGKALIVFVAFTTAIKAVTAALTLFNLIAAANPISLMVIGVFLLIGAFTALVVWIDDVIAGFDKLPKFIQFVLAPIELLINAIKFVKDNIGEIGAIATKAGDFLSKFTGFGDTEIEATKNINVIKSGQSINADINEAVKKVNVNINNDKGFLNSIEKVFNDKKPAETFKQTQQFKNVIEFPVKQQDIEPQIQTQAQMQVISREERLANQLIESRGTAEVIIKDESGRAEIQQDDTPQGIDLTLAKTGSFE